MDDKEIKKALHKGNKELADRLIKVMLEKGILVKDSLRHSSYFT